MSWGQAIMGGISLVSGAKQSDAAKEAASTQASAAQYGSDVQRGMYEQNLALQKPYRTAGYNALAQLQYLLGMEPTAYAEGSMAGGNMNYAMDPASTNLIQQAYGKGIDGSMIGDLQEFYRKRDAADNAMLAKERAALAPKITSQFQPTGSFGELAKKFDMSSFHQDPGYQFRMDEANKALQRSAAARGGLLSGGTLRGLSDLNQNLASQEYQSAYNRFQNDQTSRFNRLAALAGIGQTATNVTGQLGQNYASSAAELAAQGANAKAAGTLGSASAWNQGINSAIQGYNNYNTWNQLMGNINKNNYISGDFGAEDQAAANLEQQG